MKAIQAVIFDCDGVMFDTEKVNRMYYNRVLARMGRPDMSDDEFAYAHMQTADETFALLFPDPAELARAQALRRTFDYSDLLQYMEPEPYLKPLLKKLRPVCKTAIATNRADTMPGVMRFFELEDDFDMVVTALDVTHPKPHPESLVKILKHFRITPVEALYIGDSLVDEQASRASGVRFAAYRNPALSAEFHITDLKEVEEIPGILL